MGLFVVFDFAWGGFIPFLALFFPTGQLRSVGNIMLPILCSSSRSCPRTLQVSDGLTWCSSSGRHANGHVSPHILVHGQVRVASDCRLAFPTHFRFRSDALGYAVRSRCAAASRARTSSL